MSDHQTRNKLLEEYEDALMRLVVYDAAELEGQSLLEESKRLRVSPEWKSSPEAQQKFLRRLNAAYSENKRKVVKRTLYKALRMSVISLLVVTTVFIIAMTTVQAFRATVMNLWLDIGPAYTSFRLKGSEVVDSELVSWTNAYVPTYIPEGYKLSTFSVGKLYKRIVFEDDQEPGSTISYIELSSASHLNIDTEDASRFETVLINGYNATLVLKNDTVTIVWEMDGILFTIQAQTSVDIAIKIAEGVRFVK